MKKYPLVSFCISTYKRSNFLKSTIEIILNQKYENVEIVISEDPSDTTSEEMVKAFKSKKIIYHKNKTHIGMVKSFNKAFSLSHGDFVSILADDDPPTPNMLEIFSKVLKKYPDMKAFWGASYANIASKKVEQAVHLKQGFNSLVNKNKKYGKIEVLDPRSFFKQFFKQEIFPHYLWNASLISRDLVKKIPAVPDYNSAHFSDYAYLLKAAVQTKFVIINQELASFILHDQNYGRKQDTLEEYKRGVIGFDKTIAPLAEKLDCKEDYQNFLAEYLIMFLVNRLEHYKAHHVPVNPKQLYCVYSELSNSLPFLNTRKKELYFKLTIYYRFRGIYLLINFLRKTYGVIKLRLGIANGFLSENSDSKIDNYRNRKK